MFNQALAFRPGWYEPHVGLAQAYERLGLIDLALEEFKLAADLTDVRRKHERIEKVILLAKIGDFYSQLGQYQQAVPVYREAIALEPQWPDAYRGLGAVNRKMGDVEEAKRNLREYLRYERFGRPRWKRNKPRKDC